ncbi:hypothetical protein D9611_010889 [Ephemerocybe angulata]|uniref:F-box domain-containing protein n=1 Tax=Ephemerocybe angulata TaxID=980116 RepID=A0A8H5C4I4_9AGAR|nr:hypothetical protein D9611_010889 [Tulosesus angulatus]
MEYLPIELVESTLDNVDVKDLKACSLVTHTWRTLSQARLFRTITLSKPPNFESLLEVLEDKRSNQIASSVRHLEIDFGFLAQGGMRSDFTEAAELAGHIVARIQPRSVVLRGPRSGRRVTYRMLPFHFKHTVTHLLSMPCVEDLELDGLVFELPFEQFKTYFSSPHLRRLRLQHSFSELWSNDNGENYRPTTLQLESLDIHVDDNLDVNNNITSDLSQWLRFGPSTRLALRLWLNTAFWAYGNLGEFFTVHNATFIESLELTIGFRNNRVYDLSNHTNLHSLTIDGSNSPASLKYAIAVLSTLPPNQSSLRTVTLKFCFYTIHRKQWSDFIAFLAETLDPKVRLHLDVTTNLRAKTKEEEDSMFAMSVLAGRGVEAKLSVNDGTEDGIKRPFPFYLYSRF